MTLDSAVTYLPSAVVLRAAAIRAGVVYPGPIAALIRREIRAHVELGSRSDAEALVSSLAELVLAAPDPDELPAA